MKLFFLIFVILLGTTAQAAESYLLCSTSEPSADAGYFAKISADFTRASLSEQSPGGPFFLSDLTCKSTTDGRQSTVSCKALETLDSGYLLTVFIPGFPEPMSGTLEKYQLAWGEETHTALQFGSLYCKWESP